MDAAPNDRRTRLRASLSTHRRNPVVRTLTRGAVKLVNATRNQHNWNFAANGEMHTVRWAMDTFEGDVFDVGSNEGQWLTAALPFVGTRTVHCFEPVPFTFAALQRLSLPPTVRLNNLGLGEEPSTVSLNVNPASLDVSSRYALPEFYRSADNQLVDVAISTGDDYCAEHGVSQISLLKVDVEGMEYEALTGFSRMFAERRVGAVQFEYGLGYIGARRYLADVAEFFAEHGYQLYRQFPRDLEPFEYTMDDEDFRPRNFVASRGDS